MFFIRGNIEYIDGNQTAQPKNWHGKLKPFGSDNSAYTLRATVLALRDIAPFGRNVAYAGDVIRHFA